MQSEFNKFCRLYFDKNYVQKNIDLKNVSNSKFKKLKVLGETKETGQGLKSPLNIYNLQGCEANLSISNKKNNPQKINIDSSLYSVKNVYDEFDVLQKKIVKRIEKVELTGDEKITSSSTKDETALYSIHIDVLAKATENVNAVANLICSHYNSECLNLLANLKNLGCGVGSSGSIVIRENYSDINLFREYLKAQYNNKTPVTVIYERKDYVEINLDTDYDVYAEIPNLVISLDCENNLGFIDTTLQIKKGGF